MNLYPHWWRKNFLKVELAFSCFVSIVLIIWWKYENGDRALLDIVNANRSQIYSTLASIFGSLLGFVITALSVVLGFSSSEKLSVIRNSVNYRQLWDVFTSTTRILGFTTLSWLAALFLDREKLQRPWILLLCLAMSFLAVARLARTIWALERIVEIITTKPEQD